MSYSQTTENSTTVIVSKAQYSQVLDALERAQTEVRAGRDYVKDLEASVHRKQKLIKTLETKDALSITAIERLKGEIKLLEAAIETQKREIELKNKEIDLLKKSLEKTQKKLSNARKVTKVLIVVAVTLGVVVLLK